ncbi:hypothetical protein CRE_25948 [Caenorhabditis remanei]|uniref:Homeobox domain-containing protein n=1 Tax=Caenorhabditis remanei TaxID=31234 RepID=E3NKL2_CAERE|nr:hypothetical protein CRE_25948 [Caenorhabditis remanei]
MDKIPKDEELLLFPVKEEPLIVPKIEEDSYEETYEAYSPPVEQPKQDPNESLRDYLMGTTQPPPRPKELTQEDIDLLESVFLDFVTEKGIFFDADVMIKSLIRKTCLTRNELRDWIRVRKEKVRQEVPACLSKSTSAVFERVYSDLKTKNGGCTPFLSPEELDNLAEEVNESKKVIQRWFNYKRYREKMQQERAAVKPLPKAPIPRRHSAVKRPCPPPSVSDEDRKIFQKQIKILEDLYEEYGHNGMELSVQDLQFLGSKGEMGREELEEWFQLKIVEENVSNHLTQYMEASKDPFTTIIKSQSLTAFFNNEYNKQKWTTPARNQMLSNSSNLAPYVIDRWFIDKKYKEDSKIALNAYRQAASLRYNEEYPFFSKVSPGMRSALIEIRNDPKKSTKDFLKLCQQRNEHVEMTDFTFFYGKENRNEREFQKEYLEEQLKKITPEEQEVLTTVFYEWRINVNMFLKHVTHLKLSTTVIKEMHAKMKKNPPPRIEIERKPSTSTQIPEPGYVEVKAEEVDYEEPIYEEQVVAVEDQKNIDLLITNPQNGTDYFETKQEIFEFEEIPGPSSQLLEQVPEEHWIEESEYDAYEAREYEYQYEEPLIEGDEDQKAAHLLEMELRDQEYFEEKKPETGFD